MIYVQTKLTQDVHARLTAFLERLKARARANPTRHRPGLDRAKAGLSDAVAELLWLADQEAMRKASHGRRKADPQTAPLREGRVVAVVRADPREGDGSV